MTLTDLAIRVALGANFDQKLSSSGLSLIKKFEALRLDAYTDTGGVWTIGWGTTKGIKPGMTISVGTAELLLAEDIAETESAVRPLVRYRLRQNEYDALISFVYNVGIEAFKNSTLRRKLNNGEKETAAPQFDRWVYDNGRVVNGLVKRRDLEKRIFLGKALY